jgi:hypothetical protein
MELKRSKGRPRKTTADSKPKKLAGGKRGRPSKNRQLEVDSYILRNAKPKKEKKSIAIIKKVEMGTSGYDWSFLVGKRVQLKKPSMPLSPDLYYGHIMEEGYSSVDMVFHKNELEFINN